MDFKGNIIDCPTALHSGAEIIVSLSVYLRPAAFEAPKVPVEEQSKHTVIDETQETLAEQILRQRKSALIHLFDVLDVKPSKLGSFRKQKGKELSYDDLTLLTQQHQKSATNQSRTEIVGDGEEVKVEDDGEELNQNELNLIYKKYVVPTIMHYLWPSC